MRIAVTGASGKIGGRVAQLLAGGPATLRLLVRDPARAPRIDGAEIATAPYGDAAACRAAFAGVDVALVVSAAESEDRLVEHRTVLAAAAAAGVGHLVYTSFLGASPEAGFLLARDHAATETMLREAVPAWTILRDSFYADVLPDFAGPERVIRGPGGQGRCGWVAWEDVAQVAARVLADPAAHAGRTLTLTGPESLTLAEAASILTQVRGAEFSYLEETLEEARASRAGYGAPDWMVEAWISTYTAIASGELDVLSDDVHQVLGRRPLSLAEVAASLP